MRALALALALAGCGPSRAGEPFVEYQLHAIAARPDRFVAVAGYGDGGPGYICLDSSEGGYEPTASRVGAPSEIRLKAAIEELLR
jgi:hypothetical protein